MPKVAGDGKPRSNKRQASRTLYKRVTEDQLVAFEGRAHAAGFDSYQDYLTAFALGEAGLDLEVRKTAIKGMGELGKIGSNINQITKAINAGRVADVSAEALQIIDGARAAVERVGVEFRETLRNDR